MVFWMPTIVGPCVQSFRLDNLIALFKDHGIDARVTFWPLSSTPIKKYCRIHSGSNSSQFNLRSINLPSPFCLTLEDQDRVIKVLDIHNQSNT